MVRSSLLLIAGLVACIFSHESFANRPGKFTKLPAACSRALASRAPDRTGFVVMGMSEYVNTTLKASWGIQGGDAEFNSRAKCRSRGKSLNVVRRWFYLAADMRGTFAFNLRAKTKVRETSLKLRGRFFLVSVGTRYGGKGYLWIDRYRHKDSDGRWRKIREPDQFITRVELQPREEGFLLQFKGIFEPKMKIRKRRKSPIFHCHSVIVHDRSLSSRLAIKVECARLRVRRNCPGMVGKLS
jgi:hypothetical protein